MKIKIKKSVIVQAVKKFLRQGVEEMSPKHQVDGVVNVDGVQIYYHGVYCPSDRLGNGPELQFQANQPIDQKTFDRFFSQNWQRIQERAILDIHRQMRNPGQDTQDLQISRLQS